MTQNYLWTDNPTEANVALYDPDILNECLMHLKYSDVKLTNFCINSASTDVSVKPNLLSYTGNIIKFNCGNALHLLMTGNSQSNWTLTSSHQITSSSNDLYKSFDNTDYTYCALNHTPSLETPALLSIEKNTNFSFDYLYLKFKTVINPGDIKSFTVTDENDETLYSYDNFDDYLDKDEFLIPIFYYYGTKINISVTSNVNDVTYVNFPSIIKLLDKSQVVSISNIKGNEGKIVNINDLIIPSTASAIFNIYSDIEGNIETFAAPLTKGWILPNSPSVNQVHLITSAEPLCAKKYNGTIWEEYIKVPVGYAKTNSSGIVTSVGTFPYNQNGYNLNISNFSQSLNTNGYTIFPNGLILQWGTSSLTANQSLAINFPVTFPTSCLFSGAFDTVNNTGDYNFVRAISHTASQITVQNAAEYSTSSRWIAIGY